MFNCARERKNLSNISAKIKNEVDIVTNIISEKKDIQGADSHFNNSPNKNSPALTKNMLIKNNSFIQYDSEITCPDNYDPTNFKIITMIFDELDFTGNLVIEPQDFEFNDEKFTTEFIKIKYNFLLKELENKKINIEQTNSLNFINVIKQIKLCKKDYLIKLKKINDDYHRLIKELNEEFNEDLYKLQSELFENKFCTINIDDELLDTIEYYEKILNENNKKEIRNEFYFINKIESQLIYFNDIFYALKDFDIENNMTLLRSLNESKYSYIKNKILKS